MKPRAFIGSSVEGLGVAYAVQQNLVHQAETTVWDQGIFNLSSTTIESLTNVLNQVDFGIFVFSPDDIVNIRGETSASVRDNVLFEMGLFIGKLGRDRVFFLVPSHSDIRIPTDLLGVTPGTFDANRADGSMQAATGPVCHQIRTQIAKLGLSNPEAQSTGEPEKPVQEEKIDNWMHSLIKDEYNDAREKLNIEIDKADNDKKDSLRAWLLYTNMKQNHDVGATPLLQLANRNSSDPKLQALVITFLTWEEHYSDATNLHSNLDDAVAADQDVVKALAECHISANRPQEAIDLLSSQNTSKNPEYALLAAKVYKEDDKIDQAMDLLYEALAAHPSHEKLRYSFANLAMEKYLWEIALYILNGLKWDFPNNPDYWGYLGNCCLSLNMYDVALTSYQKADELSEAKETWIAGNIGNLLSNKGLPSEAISHLKRAICLDDSSQYAYERMAGALKKRDDEDKIYQEKKIAGKGLFQSFAKTREERMKEKFGIGGSQNSQGLLN